ncbi:MAG: hypothetical protein WA130_11105 [Candidatus Methanoperedens sp.]
MIEFNDAMLDVSQNIFDTENKRHEAIDTKAIGIISIAGILITFLIGFVKIEDYREVFFLTVFSFLISVIFSIWVLIPRKTHLLLFNELIDKYEGTSQEIQITGIAATIWKTGKVLRKVCNTKATLLFISIIFLGTGVILLIILSLLRLF